MQCRQNLDEFRQNYKHTYVEFKNIIIHMFFPSKLAIYLHT